MEGDKTVNERREKLQKTLGVNLTNIGSYSLDEKVASTRNCENMIGTVQVPLGVAGPIRITSIASKKKFECYVPLATTEGALVASVNRGCKAISQSGGTNVLVEKIGATRGPVFKTKDLRHSKKFAAWLARHFIDMYQYSKKTSGHIKLLKVEPTIAGHYVFVRFCFDTDKAMGMNMATIATEEVAKFIEKETKIKCLSLSGNFCVDKKASWQNYINGRGYKVSAEVVLTKNILKNVLKTTAQKFFDVWLGKCMVGSAMSGSVGFNAQFANVIAAVFLACGQDIGHVVEGSLGITTAEIRGQDLYISVYLPDVMAGTVGGGTGLATQKEALSIIGKNYLTEVIGGAVLAGEVSLIASLSEGSLVEAHKKLGRGINGK